MTFRIITFGLVMALTVSAWAGDMADNAAEAGRDLKKGARKSVRAVQDKTCEMVNGKVECAAKEAKHKAQNVVDEVKDKVNAD